MVDVLRKSTLPDELIFMYRVLQIALPVLFLKPIYPSFVYPLKYRLCGIRTDMPGIVCIKPCFGLLCPEDVSRSIRTLSKL